MNLRVLDLFREIDDDEDGYISKKDWRKAFKVMGPEFPAATVDATFDAFDPDGSGEVEFNELEKFLRRRGPGAATTTRRKPVKKLQSAVEKTVDKSIVENEKSPPKLKMAARWRMASSNALDAEDAGGSSNANS